jgi:uncharacterized protein (DUF302 family)
MTYYKCRKCSYERKIFRDIKNHINIQKSCIKDLSCINLTNDEILIMTLMPYTNDEQNVNFDEVKNFKYTYSNKNLLLTELHNIDKTKNKVCNYCNLKFTKIQDLKKHIIMECFEKEMEKKFELKLKNVENINIYNNCKIENNITNIIFNIEKPLPFNDQWDISKMSELDKSHLMLSQLMYTHLLKEILKNDNNLNVIIDQDKGFGIVYQDDFQKYIKMEIKEIISNSMDKLKQNLLDINSELKNNLFLDKYILDYKTKEINNKYNCYKNNEETQKKVNDCIADIFDKKKDDSIKIMTNIMDKNMYNIGF